MAQESYSQFGRLARSVRLALGRVELLALFPLLTLLAVAVGKVDIAIATAVILPALLALQAFAGPRRAHHGDGSHGADTGRGVRKGKEILLAAIDGIAATPGQETACILIQIDGWDQIVDRWGSEAALDIADRVSDRLCTSLRNGDVVTRLGDARFGVVLHPIPAARLGVRDTILSRLRTTLREPIAVSGASVRLSICAGHTSLIRDGADPAGVTFAAAETALAEAHREGPDAIRAFAPGLSERRTTRTELAGEVEEALAASEIRAWFQPQVSCQTGAISGFEALARWHHPKRGLLQPGAFLPAIEDAGRMEALGHAILFHALDALSTWDEAGLRVPSVSVNFSPTELRNPALVDRVKWEVDRFDMQPGRLTVEILETVVASSKDAAIIETLTALGAHGVNLDLDDFGVGQASLAAIRRFGVSRIKIDRSFVMGLDEDPEQRSMVAAIIAMARQLGVETLAEGVETDAVRAILTEMGCDHLQGYLLARPMPVNETLSWATRHIASQPEPPRVGRRAG